MAVQQNRRERYFYPREVGHAVVGELHGLCRAHAMTRVVAQGIGIALALRKLWTALRYGECVHRQFALVMMHHKTETGGKQLLASGTSS